MDEEYSYICSLEKLANGMKNILNTQEKLFDEIGINNITDNHSMDKTLLRLKNGKKTILLRQIDETLDDNNINLFYELSTELNKL